MSTYLESNGIHTRLQYVIDNSGGLNWEKRAEYLAKEYSLPIEKTRRICKVDIENYLDNGESIDDLIERYEEYKKLKKKESEIAFNNLSTMLGAVLGMGGGHWLRR